MMKIAVQLFGHMRTFEKCFDRLNEMLLSKYDCDIFIHTWDVLDHSWDKMNNIELSSDIVRQYKIEKSKDNKLYNKILALYSPKVVCIETQNMFKIEGTYNSNNSFNETYPNPCYAVSLNAMKYMLYSMVSVNELRKNFESEYNIEYDYILFIRPDVLLGELFDISLYENEFKYSENSVISFCGYPNISIYNRRFEVGFIGIDIILLAKPNTMNKLFKSLSVFEKCYLEYPNIFKGYNVHPENSFKETALLQGINLRYYILDYKLIRKESEIIMMDSSKYPAGYYCNYIGLSNELNKQKMKTKKYKKIYKAYSVLLILFLIFFIINLV
ncbi:hypothetical protein [Lonepinella sp. BR2357]|uniref:hypothetical protein n=1 Tax=Lonepinella sp. BR2357 TaxID=3434549 RepID=UPI003F6DF807